MKQNIIQITKIILIVALYMLCTIITGSLMTPLFGLELPTGNMPDQSKVIINLFTTGLIQSLVLIMLAKRSKIKGIRLTWLLSGIFFSINHLLNVIESLVFLRNIYPVSHQLVETFNGLITAVLMGLAVTWLFGPKEEQSSEDNDFNWSIRMIPTWIGWTALWFVIYITAGALIPMSVEGFSEYYFGEQGAMDMSLVPVGYAMQIPRAAIWIFMTIFLNRCIKGSTFEKGLVIGITYGALMSSVLLIPNWLMPDLIRLTHLPEILFANMLWGFLISGSVSKHMTGAPT